MHTDPQMPKPMSEEEFEKIKKRTSETSCTSFDLLCNYDPGIVRIGIESS